MDLGKREIASKSALRWVVLLSAVPLLCSAADPTLGDVLNSFTYRNLGPFRAGAWVVDIAVPEAPAKAHQRTLYVGARTGGLWKTTNGGTTFDLVTEKDGITSIGAVAVAPSNSEIVWLGGGDASNTRSAYWGDGVYKSTDGSKTWQLMGLRDSHHISRIVIHPTNPDIVWIAAMGHLGTPNSERGVYKTTDGGRTWKQVLYTGDTVGAIDLIRDPRDPNVLYVAMYECQRYPWRLMDGGPGSGIYKTTDGGTKWQRLFAGLPGGAVGRIGIDLCRTKPGVIYAVIDNRNSRPATPEEQRSGRGNSAPTRLIGGEVYRSDDAGQNWRKQSAASDDVSRKSGYAFNQIRVDPNNTEKIYVTGSNLINSNDGGKTWIGLGRGSANERPPFRRAFGDFRTLWIDPEDSDRMIAGSDGGVFASYDGGKTSDHFSNLPLGEVYAIGLDMDSPYHVYAGLQDHENWRGPVNGPSGSVGIEDWVTTGIGDGMYNEPDPNGRWLYNTQEFGKPARVDQELHTRTIITPTRPLGQAFLRSNWIAPIKISPHDSSTIYYGAQVLLRSKDRGDHWEEISPDLTTNDPAKISQPGDSIQHCTITTLAESPKQAGVIWTGSDDGKVQVTRDAGAHWFDATAKIAQAGGSANAWVTRVYPSRFEAGTAYVTKSNRRGDDFRAFVFRTTDFGATWTSLAATLPVFGANVIVEDTVNPNLLFMGNDIGVYVSFDRGVKWQPLKANMPVVPVHDLLVHPREGDLVAGTFGRGIWITNISPLREVSANFAANDTHLFAIRPFAQRREGAWGNYRLYGDRFPTTPNEPNGMTIVYYLKQPATTATITITDAAGTLVRKLTVPGKAGINRVVWDLDDAGSRAAGPGDYTVTLSVGDRTLTRVGKLLSRAPEDSPRPQRLRSGQQEP
jgi:photosystem II stability/assembly factor-like uncharacterized protein